MKLLGFIKFLFCFLFVIISFTAAAQNVVVGKVLDELDRSAVANAMIIVKDDTVITDTMGSFAFINAKNAKEILVISRDYAPAKIKLSDNSEIGLTILLSIEGSKYQKDKKNDKYIKNVDKLTGEANDTSNFNAVLGKFRVVLLDQNTNLPIEYASIYMREAQDGGISDSLGFIELLFDGDTQSLKITALGYVDKDTIVKSMPDTESAINVYLTPEKSEIGEVKIIAKRDRYKNKNNPAVALVRKVISKKESNKMLKNEDGKFESYDKMVLYVSNLPKIVSKLFLFKPFRFVFQNEDTTILERRRLLPLFIAENIADNYYSKSKNATAKVLTSEKRIRFNSDIVESNNISSFLDRLYDQVDIYDDKIRVLNNFFLSPIAPASPSFYKFFIIDTTLNVNNQQVVQIKFLPRNKKDFLFEGKMFVTLDPDYAVTKVDLNVPKGTSLNWTNGLNINLGFEKQANGKYWQTSSKYVVNFGFYNSKRGAVGSRQIYKKNYQSNPVIPDTVFDTKQKFLENDADTFYQKSNEFWEKNRNVPLTYFESKAYSNIDSAKELRAYKNMMNIGYVLFSGHKQFKDFEIGSLYDIYSYNEVEGSKFRLGIRSNIKTWQKFLLEGYGAYGLKDKRFKYYAGGTFSLNNRYVYGFPAHYLKLSYQYDVRAPGQELGFATQEKVQDIIKRGDNNRYLYNKLFTLNYTKEFQKRLTVTLGYNNWKQESAGNLYFTKSDGSNDTIKTLSTNEISLDLRFSPNEMFYQYKRYRGRMMNNAWVFNLKGTLGFNKGFGNNAIAYQKIEGIINKRFNLAPLGYADLTLKGGYLFGNVPYTFLFIPPANQSFYRFSIGSYNLMNYMEFASDKFVSATIDYHMKGFLMNRLPLVNKLYLREVFSFKAIYGGLRKSNMPVYNPSLIKFPTDKDGNSIVNSFSNVPYLELSVGIENIMKIVRIDYVKRLTYKNLPLVDDWGIRVSVGFDY